MENVQEIQTVDDDTLPYSLHVSSRYLELTRRKLELTRLPREIELSKEREWILGAPKSALEPLIDLWLDKYSWREHESALNKDLPQFRAEVAYNDDNSNAESEEVLRIHFVHKRSIAEDSIPLLYCHGWPGCFLEVSKIINPLTSPIPTDLHRAEDSPSFHVVAPSIPGFGFSDSSSREGFGLRHTAMVFNNLMRKLGYDRYIIYASQCGFKVARFIALNYPSNCIALLTTCSSPIPTLTPTLPNLALLKVYSARLNRGRIPWFTLSHNLQDPPIAEDGLTILATHPQTTAYALCDSPVGLLASVLHHLYATQHLHLWSPVDVLNWTMLLWLPGPEAPLRWLHAVLQEDPSWETAWSNVPLGVHVYHAPEPALKPKEPWSWNFRSAAGIFGGVGKWVRWTERAGPVWLEGVQKVVWVKRSTGSVGIPAWDAAGDVILDLREFCATGRREGWLRIGTEERPDLVDGQGNNRNNDTNTDQEQTSAAKWGLTRWGWPLNRDKLKNEPQPQATPTTVITIEKPSADVEHINTESAVQGHSMLRWLWPFREKPISDQTTATATSLAVTEQPTETIDRAEPKEETVEGLGISHVDQEDNMSQKNITVESPVDRDSARLAGEQEQEKSEGQQRTIAESASKWPFNLISRGEGTKRKH